MPRVLIVTYPWFPAVGGGVKHMATLARYLPDAGWDPIILTKDWSDGATEEDAILGLTFESGEESPTLRAVHAVPVVHTGYGPRENRATRWRDSLAARSEGEHAWSMRKVARGALAAAYPLYGAYPDAFRGWTQHATRAGIAAVRQYGIGAVVSISSPASAHIAAGEIARQAGIPWIPLFGDLESFYFGPGDGRSLGRRFAQRALARRWLRGATRASAISPGMVAHLRTQYRLSAETLVVPFDPEERRVPPRRIVGTPLRMVHVGRLRLETLRFQLLIDALDMLLAANPNLAQWVRVDLVGSGSIAAIQAVLAGRLSGPLFNLTAAVTPTEAIRLQREADVLLHFARTQEAAERTETLPYPPTLFEQLNARRPTLAVGASVGSYVAHILAETRAGDVGEHAADVAALLQRALEELRTTGEVPFRGDDAAIAKFGGPEQARRLAGFLDTASAERFGSWQRK